MKKGLITWFICSQLFFISAQETSNYKHTIGARFSGMYINTTELHPWGKTNSFELRVEPYYLYSFNTWFSMGVQGEYHTAWSNAEQIDILPDQYGLGIIARFNYPNPFQVEWIQKRVNFYGEFGWSLTNFYNKDSNQFVYSNNGNLRYSLFRIRPVGFNVRLFRTFYFDASLCVYKFVPGRVRFLPNFGLNFLF